MRAETIVGKRSEPMTEKTERKHKFEERIPEDVRQHAKAARDEMHNRRNARKEMLLAFRSMIDHAIERVDDPMKKA
jgi:hypothetical protein